LLPRIAAVSSEMHPRADALELLDDEPPAGRRLQRDLELLADEALQEPADPRAVGRRHASPGYLSRLGIQPLGRDLRSVLVSAHYDRHSGPPQAPRFERLRGPAPRLS
jgi:hypothetical protein